MPNPIEFSDTTARFSLPYLRPAQAQKEMFVNQAFAITDCLMQSAVKAVIATPPTEPGEGQCWLVAQGATGDWAGRDDMLASYQAASWVFIQPVAGLRIFDESARQFIHYDSGWKRLQNLAEVTGGAMVDSELRTAFASLVTALTTAGFFSFTP